MIGWRPLVLLGLAIVLVFAAFLDVGNAAACGDAESLLTHGRFSEARTAYVKLLDDPATAKCAEEGLAGVAKKQCSRAKALADSGRNEDADKEYTAIATSEPVPGAEACTKALGPSAAPTCADGDAVRTRGQLNEARTAYVALLADPANAQCAKRGLTAIGMARCRAARDLLAANGDTAAKKALAELAITEPLRPTVTKCALTALRGES
jgi:hypothetical protein